MGKALSDPARPFVAILGGAKVSDKIGVIENLIDKCDTIIIGGGMAYTFSKAQGGEIGTSLCEEDKIELALGLLKKAADKGVKLLLPVDTVCADHFGADAAPVVYEAGKIPADMMGMDIGPKTVELFSEAVKDAGTVVWNVRWAYSSLTPSQSAPRLLPRQSLRARLFPSSAAATPQLLLRSWALLIR